MPKLAIVRTSGRPIDPTTYNMQEHGLAKELAVQGWKCDIYTASRSGKFLVTQDRPDLTITELPCRTFLGDQGVFAGLVDHLRRGQYDIIQVAEHWQVSSVFVANAFKRTGAQIVLWQGKYADNRGLRRLQCILADRVAVPLLRGRIARALCKTRAAEAYLHGKGITATTVLPVGLDTSRWNGYTPRARYTPGEAFELLYVGQVRRPRRDVPFLIDLVFSLNQAGLRPKLTVVGDGPDIPYCRHKIDTMGLNRQVHLAGMVPQSKLPAYYTNANALVHPTKADIYGMTILEGMYFGLPVLSGNAAGPADIISDGEDGFLQDTLDLATWTERIQMLASDASVWQKVADRAARKARHELSWNSLGSRYSDFYHALIASSGENHR